MNPRSIAPTVSLLFGAAYSLVAGPALTRLHSFGFGASAAAQPYARLLQASDGKLYGTTSVGGQSGQGAVFRFNPDGSGFVVLKSFSPGTNDGHLPFAAVIEGSDGALYGTTESGGDFGSGTVFRLNRDGTGFAVLKSFSGGVDGAAPDASLLEASDGFLYGTASGGGSNDNGVVFRMGKDGSGFTSLMQFNGTNGANPECELIEASDGLLYGTTAASRTATNSGTIFRLQKDGNGFSVLDRFVITTSIKTNGAAPQSRLVEGTNGMLYGTTSAGGTKGMGTIYRLNKDGTGLAMIYHFGTNATDGRYPLGDLLLADDGMLYGTTFDDGTNGNGTIFRIAQDGTQYAEIASPTFAQGPAAGLVQGSNGMLYGTTQLGGLSGDGTAFALQKDGSGFVVLKSFSASGEDGKLPQSPPVLAQTNSLIGTTRLGGALGGGTVYAIRFDGLGYGTITGVGGTGGGPFDLFAPVLPLSDGTLAGVSRYGGSINAGTIFGTDSSGANLQVLYSPAVNTDGSEFRAALIQGSDGLLYGTAVSGGSGEGTVFHVNADGSGYTVIKTFALGANGPGANPVAPLLEGSDGNLYGTTYFGGITNRGVIFKLTKDGSAFAVLKQFGVPASTGETPLSPLLEGSDGSLYGSTYGGGSTNNAGTIFRIHKDGTGFQVILAFSGLDADARHPRGALVEWANGALYGATERGGATDEGALWRVNKDGSGYQLLASLGGMSGVYPRGGLVKGPDDALYGSTEQGGDLGFGTLFRYGSAFGDIMDLQFFNQVPVLTAIGQPGTNYVLERTLQLGPLASWSQVGSTNAPLTGGFSLADPGFPIGSAPQSFYRLRW